MNDEYDEYREEELRELCGMTIEGYCSLVGTEHCDFDCPYRHQYMQESEQEGGEGKT